MLLYGLFFFIIISVFSFPWKTLLTFYSFFFFIELSVSNGKPHYYSMVSFSLRGLPFPTEPYFFFWGFFFYIIILFLTFLERYFSKSNQPICTKFSAEDPTIIILFYCLFLNILFILIIWVYVSNGRPSCFFTVTISLSLLGSSNSHGGPSCYYKGFSSLLAWGFPIPTEDPTIFY